MILSAPSAASLIIAGTAFFTTAFFLANKLIKWTAPHLLLKQQHQIDLIPDIANKLVSAFQALIASFLGLLIIRANIGDVLNHSTPLAEAYSWFGLPYFIYDTFSMFYVHWVRERENPSAKLFTQVISFFKKKPLIIVHHIVMAPLGFILIAFWRAVPPRGDFFVGILFMMECSTPFVCLRHILSKLGVRKSSFLYIANGVLMLIFFPTFRIISVIWATILYSEQHGTGSYVQTMWEMPLIPKAIIVVSLSPQLYWQTLMWRGLMKIIRGENTKTE